MSFRDNLQHLRATRNMTQEQLAMLLGVSRQTVTKWEAEKSNPEMDKLIDMCRIFDCTLDDLVRGDLTDRPREAVAMPSSGAPVDVCGYDEHMRGWAFSVATGVAVIILGVSAGMLFAMADLLPVRATRPFRGGVGRRSRWPGVSDSRGRAPFRVRQGPSLYRGFLYDRGEDACSRVRHACRRVRHRPHLRGSRRGAAERGHGPRGPRCRGDAGVHGCGRVAVHLLRHDERAHQRGSAQQDHRRRARVRGYPERANRRRHQAASAAEEKKQATSSARYAASS